MANITYTFKRKENKYLLTKKQYQNLMDEIGVHLVGDVFGKSTICNIYYDTPSFRLIRKSLEKPVYKEKLRSRSYGVASSDTKIFYELKKKYKGIVYKRRLESRADKDIKEIITNPEEKKQVADEIGHFYNLYEDIGPAMYIAYDREAFYSNEDSNLRITFDSNILWRTDNLDLRKPIYGTSVINSDQCLMEIKCAGAMPLWLAKALSNNEIKKTSFSKYGKSYHALLKNKNRIKEAS